MRTVTLSLSVLAASLAITACDPLPAPPTTAASAASAGQSVAPQQAAAPVTSADIQALAKDDNAFALDLYAKMRAQKGNLVASPFSIHTALAMTVPGARGDTLAQMKKVLHLDGDRAIDASGSLLQSYGAPGQKVTLRIANRLFGDKSYAFEPSYLGRVNAAFGAPLEQLDFRGAPQDARKHINDWVARQTEDRIKDLIPPDGINPLTRLVVTNAIYFLGDWAQPFKSESTSPAPFFTTKSEQHPVPTMHQTAQLRVAVTDGVKVLDMPYQGNELAMTFILPDAVDGLDAVEARLDPELLQKWFGAATSTQVAVSLPKVELSQDLPLGGTLAAMGMPLAFDPSRADFTGMASSSSERLSISQVFHKAFVKMDEKGTEAAAATGVVMSTRAARLPIKPPVEFKADHPYLYLLRDTRTGLILFMGRVADPAAK